MVVGLGESKTPAPFCAACNEFKFLDRIIDEEDEKEEKQGKINGSRKNEGKAGANKISNSKKDIKEEKDDETSITPFDTIATALKDIILANGDEVNGIDMGELGSRLQKRYPDFDTRNYGYSKFSIFLKKFDFLTMEHIGTSITVTLNLPDENEDLATKIVEMVTNHGEKGINMGTLSMEIKNEYPDFTPKEYGFSKFEQYIRSIDGLEVKNITPLNKRVYIKK